MRERPDDRAMLRLFTVQLKSEPGRAYVVLGSREDGWLLLADEKNSLGWWNTGDLLLGQHYFDQDQREWWRSMSPPPPHEDA